MLTFLLKSTACLAIFMAFYKLVLEKESVHQFKRFFLLGALITSFIIPNLVFIEYIDTVETTTTSMAWVTDQISDGASVQSIPQASVFDWQLLLWMIYGLGVLGFGLRFIANLFRIRLRIKKNPKFKENFVTKVLLNQTLPPHTFLSYIFLNQKQHKENSIPQEVLLHEETHAKQRHSLDILFIELAQVIFWFNPLIFLFKSSIKLNHEFLADQAVINKEHDYSHYQNTLLSYLSNEKHQSVGIANAINYSSIKKRFTVMKTNTSKKSFVFRSLLLLPLTALLLFGFSEHRQIERAIAADHIITMDLLRNENVQIENDVVHFNEVAQVLNQKYLSTYNSEKTKVEINIVQAVYLKTINDWSKEIRTTGIDLIEVFANEVIMEKSEFQENVPLTSSTTRLNAKQMTVMGVDNAQKESLPQNDGQKTINPINIKINKSGQILFQRDLVPLGDLKATLLRVNDHLSFDERKKTLRSVIEVDNNTPKNIIDQVDQILDEYGSATINIVGPEMVYQGSATRKEMKEYNTLAKKYNQMDRNHMVIKKGEVMRLKTIYGKMSKKQQADAEPFPNFPPPPPAPGAPEPPKSPLGTKEIMEVAPHKTNVPPAPPAPPKPIDHIKEMAEKGATFMLNGKKISAKKAIEVVENNNIINIDVRGSKAKNPVVKLSVDPIEINN